MQKATARDLRPQKSYPDKLFYKIGEVSRIVDVEPYVLRYWESEFSFLRPRKSRSGQRVYIKKDLELIIEIKRLLYTERYTIEGVRKKLGEQPGRRIEDDPPSRSPMSHVRRRLREMLEQLQ